MKQLFVLTVVASFAAAAHAEVVFEELFDEAQTWADWDVSGAGGTVAGGNVTVGPATGWIRTKVEVTPFDSPGAVIDAGGVVNAEFVARFNGGTNGKNLKVGLDAADEGTQVNLFGGTLTANHQFGAPQTDPDIPEAADLGGVTNQNGWAGYNILLYPDRTEFYVHPYEDGKGKKPAGPTTLTTITQTAPGAFANAAKTYRLKITQGEGCFGCASVDVAEIRLKTDATLLPEPASLMLLGGGLTCLLARRRRQS